MQNKEEYISGYRVAVKELVESCSNLQPLPPDVIELHSQLDKLWADGGSELYTLALLLNTLGLKLSIKPIA